MKDTQAYIESLTLADGLRTGITTRSRSLEDPSEPVPLPIAPAVVNVGSLVSFVSGLDPQEMRDVLSTVQLAQRGASGSYNRFTDTPKWYNKYIEILGTVGWVGEQLAFAEYQQSAGHLEMDKAALEVIAAVATSQQLQALTTCLGALRKLSSGDQPITLFELNSLAQSSGNFQLGTVQKAPANGALTMGLGAFYFSASRQQGKFLFFSWGDRETRLWTAVQKLTLDPDIYVPLRSQIAQKLGAEGPHYVSALTLSP